MNKFATNEFLQLEIVKLLKNLYLTSLNSKHILYLLV